MKRNFLIGPLACVAVAALIFAVANLSVAAFKILDLSAGSGDTPRSQTVHFSPSASIPSIATTTQAEAPPAVATPLTDVLPTADPPADTGLLKEIQTAQNVVGSFWARHWSENFSGIYFPPKILGLYDGTSSSVPHCGMQRLPAANAEYCKAGDYLAWDIGLMKVGYQNGGRTWPYLIIAHEWGHAIQARLNKSWTLPAAELQADCLAGAALFGSAADGTLEFAPGDQKALAQELVSISDETPWTRVSDHGDPFQRITAFDKGRQDGVRSCFLS